MRGTHGINNILTLASSPMDPHQAPKQFCDNINVSHNEEFFIFQVFSGTSNIVYAMTPEHIKRLSIALQWHVSEFEKKYGGISAEWPPRITSPIQPGDLPGAKKPKKRSKHDSE